MEKGGKIMAPLKSLQLECPIIDSNFLEFCASHDIFSVEDFLVRDLYLLAASTEEHATADRLKQVITQILSIIDSLHQPWLNGLELWECSRNSNRFVSTGCERIDAFLRGGLSGGFLTELVGPSSSGKTQICLLAASNCAKTLSSKVMFIDTGNSFSAKRIAHFVSSTPNLGHNEADRVILQVLVNINCVSVFDIFNLLDLLHQIQKDLGFQTKRDLRMLIIDSISSLVTPVLGGAGTHGHALMTYVGYVLKKLAHEHNLVILVTNHMVGGEGGSTKPALGETWKSIPHVRLMLSSPNQASNTSTMSILKHPSRAIGERVEFMVI